jgi:hypothetical protein
MLDFLCTVDVRKWQDSNVRLRQPGTGIWFTDGIEFRSWLSSRNSKLWINGIRRSRGLIQLHIILNFSNSWGGEDDSCVSPSGDVLHNLADFRRESSSVIQELQKITNISHKTGNRVSNILYNYYLSTFKLLLSSIATTKTKEHMTRIPF